MVGRFDPRRGWCRRLAAGAAICGLWSAADAADINGFWRPIEEPQIAKPVLRPGAAARLKGVKIVDGVDVEAVRWCVQQGFPYVMTRAGDIQIVRGRLETMILPTKVGMVRHIYTSGQTHPDPDAYDNTAVGHSIGTWQGDMLAIDSVGFKDGVGPAGVPRSERAHLVERMTLAPDGGRLTVQSTWTDPAVLQKPLSWTTTYTRVTDEHEPDDGYCDPRQNGVVR